MEKRATESYHGKPMAGEICYNEGIIAHWGLGVMKIWHHVHDHIEYLYGEPALWPIQGEEE